MSWQTDLQDASFRGVTFDVISTGDTITKSLVRHRIPYTNGAEIEDMGSDAQPLRLQIIFFGDDYLDRLDKFLRAFNAPGAGELVHPVFGVMQVVGESCETAHDAESPDSATLNVTFVRDGRRIDVFDEVSALQQCALIDTEAQAARLSAIDAFAARIQGLSVVQATTDGFRRVTQMRDRAVRAAQQLRAVTHGVIATAYDVISAPYDFAAEIGALADGMIDLRAFDTDIMKAQWRALSDQFSRVLRLPEDGKLVDGNTAADNQSLNLLLATQAYRSTASISALVYSLEQDNPLLTPPEIEEVASDLRTKAEALIQQHLRYATDPVAAQAVIEALRRSVDAAQKAAQVLLNARPPLVQRTVASAMPLRLVAFYWYGDEGRTAELLRLNPQIPQPAFMQPGDILNAYAR